MSTLAASLLGLGTTTIDGRRWVDASVMEWERALAPFVAAGYTAVELPSTWLDLAELSGKQRTDLARMLDGIGVAPIGVLAARRSVVDPDHWRSHLEASRRMIDAAAELGAAVFCTGLHGRLSSLAESAVWFWSEPDALPDHRLWDNAVSRIRQLAQHAASAGLTLSLELYERTFLGDPASAVRFVTAVDHPACGINADLGNLQRAPEPVLRWEQMLSIVAPHMNYWHVKNCMRVEDRERAVYLSWPTDLRAGVIDYRRAVALARHAGYTGPLIVEHYGGDAVGAICEARPYAASLSDIAGLASVSGTDTR